jgi:hypothetical protein
VRRSRSGNTCCSYSDDAAASGYLHEGVADGCVQRLQTQSLHRHRPRCVCVGVLTDRLTAGYWIGSSLRIRSERRCGRWERAHAADDALTGHDPWPRARAARAHDALAQRPRDPRPGGLPRRGCVLYICNTPLINERCGIDLHCFFFSEPSVPTGMRVCMCHTVCLCHARSHISC